MARGTGTVTVKFLGDVSDLKKATGEAESRLGKVGGAIGGMAKTAAMVGGPALVAFGALAVKMGSDVNESLSKVNTVFGQSGADIDAWAKNAAGSIGLSRGAALDAAGSFGNMFTQLGIGTKQAATMSKGIVGLAADFASFHNADISEVITAQQAAFRGEYDSLQRFLPLINAATVEQRALAMTGKATTKELTAQDKALAVNALMQEGAGEAAGDFSRTSGGLANQLRILKAQGENFAASVGTVLLPIVIEGLSRFTEWGGILKEQLTPAFKVVGGVVGDAVGWIKDLVARFKEGGAGMEETGGQISEMVGQLKEVFSSAFEAIKEVVRTAVDFLKGIWRVFGDDLMAFAREFWATIQETFRGAMEVLGGIFDLIKSLLTGKWGEAWDALKKIVDGVWDTIFSVVRGAVTNVIPTIISGAGQVISSAARTAFDGLKEVFKGVLNWIIDRWNGLDFKVPEFGIGPAKFGGYTIGLPEIPRFHQGGVVPGPPGADVLGVLRAGERVLPAGMGGTVINLTVNGWVGDDVALTRKIIAALNAEARRSGSLVA